MLTRLAKSPGCAVLPGISTVWEESASDVATVRALFRIKLNYEVRKLLEWDLH
jgi:hypothetical protein